MSFSTFPMAISPSKKTYVLAADARMKRLAIMTQVPPPMMVAAFFKNLVLVNSLEVSRRTSLEAKQANL